MMIITQQNTRKLIKVFDLKDQLETPYPRPILYCTECRAEYSANKGDYFMASPDYIFRHCGKPMLLVVKREVYTEVAA
jgi:hypothetical protein